jgi:hypothetical protein
MIRVAWLQTRIRVQGRYSQGAKAIIQDRRIMYGLKPVPFNDG